MIRVGEKLKEERKKRGLTLEEVARATRIRVNFLDAIEKGEYEKLPGSNYAHGFVKNYLEFLGFPLREYLALFRREYDENAERAIMPKGLVGGQGISLRKFTFRQTVVVGIVILLGLFSYLLFQYRAALFSPSLSVMIPTEHQTVASEIVTVSGTTDPNVAITVNTLPAYVDANGKFTKQLPIFPGNITITVKAANSFGKITTVERHITVVQ